MTRYGRTQKSGGEAGEVQDGARLPAGSRLALAASLPGLIMLLLVITLLAFAVWPNVAAADLRVGSTVALAREDGSAIQVAQNLRVWCGRWERDVPRRTLHIRVGAREGPFWTLDAVVADVRRRPVVRFPHSFVWNRPTGAQLFAVDGDNEASSSEEEASGRISFRRVRCGRRLAVRFRVRAVLGSEFFGGDALTMRGSFHASK
jgi:hypothetical protein